MVTSSLVDLEAGQVLVETLDAQGMPPAAAFWSYLPDAGSWRMILAFDSVDSDGKRATYEKLQKAITGFESLRLKDISVLSPRDKSVAALRRMLRVRRHGQAPIRVTGAVVDGTYVDDVLIYRL
jgi:hypothetical protein